MKKVLEATQLAMDALFALNAANIAHKKAKDAIRHALGEEYPLSALVGKPFIYSRAMWGSPTTGIMDDAAVLHYAYMQPLMLEVGREAGQQHSRMGFEEEGLYACYVCLESESSWDDEHPEYWEYLFVKLN